MNDLFENCGVTADILKSLSRMNITRATPVQAKVIGPFLEGRDLLVEAPTGTGKTCAFGIPMVQMAATRPGRTQGLILCPTRELALQTTTVLRQLSEGMPGFAVTAIYGGENIQRQISALRRNPRILVATPGRLVDHINRGTVDLRGIRTLVLDEADSMLDMGFRHDLNIILNASPKERQTVLLSATLSGEVKEIATKYQQAPLAIRIAKEPVAEAAIKQYFAKVQKDCKNDELTALLKAKEYPLALVFVRTKRRAQSLALLLGKRGLAAGALHGNMSQPQRDRMMKAFRLGQINILVATDVAARGIDVREIDAVINYDIPEDSDSYTHRIGRTGRAAHQGVALTFVDTDEVTKIRRILGNRAIQYVPLAEGQYGLGM